MGNITNFINNIKTAVFGKDVRKSICDAIEQCYDDAIANGHTDMEVAQARGCFSNLNKRLDSADLKVQSLASGSPLVASSVSEMTDTSRVYVNTSDGYWYYYNGSSWADGGVYQAAEFETDKTLTEYNGIADAKIVGDKINNYFNKLNLFDYENSLVNKSISETGSILTTSNFIVTNLVPVKENDKVYLQYFDTTLNSTPSIKHILKYDSQMNFIERIETTDYKKYVSDFTGYVRFNIQYLLSSGTEYDMQNCFVLSKNCLVNEYIKNYKFNSNLILNEINERLDDISYKENYFVYDELLDNHSMQNNGYILTPGNNYCVTNKIKVKNGDIINLSYFGNDNANVYLYQVLKYTTENDWIERINLDNKSKSYTSDFDGYVRFNIFKTEGTNLGNTLVLSKNKILKKYFDSSYRVVDKDNVNNVNITKINDMLYKITFGKFNLDLFYTENESTNNHNWNLKEVRNGENVIVPVGTDIIGPVKINNNNDFIGGVHGDETTDYITIACDGVSYNLEDINSIDCETLTIVMKSKCYDEITKEYTFDRFVQVIFSPNKIFVSNSFKAVVSCTLVRATNGGLIACRNSIIKDIIFNNSYFSEAPTTAVNNQSKKNIMATINTIYGSVTVRNITGHENNSYKGNLAVFTSENPMRCKVYLDTYSTGNYEISNGDTIDGSFEYIFS